MNEQRVRMTVVCLCLGVSIGLASVQADNWPHWRGPEFNGSSAEAGLPTDWSMTDNIAWKFDLPGCSAATPIIWGDSVFLSNTDEENDALLAICLDRKTGNTRWQHTIAPGTHRDRRSSYAAASPATDGEHVIFLYSTGEVVAFDVAGRRLWDRNLHEDYGPFAFQWTYASSPTLYEGRLYIQVLQRDVPVGGRGKPGRANASYILAVDPATGKTLWRQIRPSKGVAESREAFTTPIPAELDGTKQLLIGGGDCLTGHDLVTGKELWRWGTYNPRRKGHWRLVPSPVAGKDTVLICAPKNEPVYAIQPHKKTGVLDDSALAWDSELNRNVVTSDVPAPAFYDGDFFVLNDRRQHLSRIEPRTGEVKWSERAPGRSKYEASPVLADGKVYVINQAGDVGIMSAANGEVLNVIPMDDTRGGDLVRASIAVSQGQLFIRTSRTLYCVGSS